MVETEGYGASNLSICKISTSNICRIGNSMKIEIPIRKELEALSEELGLDIEDLESLIEEHRGILIESARDIILDIVNEYASLDIGCVIDFPDGL